MHKGQSDRRARDTPTPDPPLQRVPHLHGVTGEVAVDDHLATVDAHDASVDPSGPRACPRELDFDVVLGREGPAVVAN